MDFFRDIFQSKEREYSRFMFYAIDQLAGLERERERAAVSGIKQDGRIPPSADKFNRNRPAASTYTSPYSVLCTLYSRGQGCSSTGFQTER